MKFHSIFRHLRKRDIVALFLVLLFCVGIYGAYRPIPKELGLEGDIFRLSDQSVRFLSDETFLDAEGVRTSEQTIFNEVFQMIARADSYILIDMFLWNPFQGAKAETYRALSRELTDTLLAKKLTNPEIQIFVISDPINTVYAGQRSAQFDELRAAGITVVMTDHMALRDSNPTYSMFWRSLLQWPDLLHQTMLGKDYTFRLLPNIMNAGGEPVPARSYLKLFNFKANHRKLIIADEVTENGRKMVTLVTSANPHDGSSAHSNVALRVDGGVWRDAIVSEQMVATFSGVPIPDYLHADEVSIEDGDISASLITESAILDKVLSMIGSTNEGDEIDLAMFYFSETQIINALIDASRRGVLVRVILDPNKDAFGMEKNGIPNRSVSARLRAGSEEHIDIRWCSTHGEQCHTKMLLVATPTEHALTLGSANYTRRNLRDLNLETNIWVSSATTSTAFLDAQAYFNRMWINDRGRIYTVPYEDYKDETILHDVIARFMERTGLSTF